MDINNKNLSFPLKASNIYVVADFDKTITDGTSESSWSVFAHSELFPDTYSKERKQLFNYYRPIELDENFDPKEKQRLMEEWTLNLLKLFKKYDITESQFNRAIAETKILKLRAGAIDFLKFLYKNNIPLIIMSAGVGNVIEFFLKNNNCLYDNIYIASNKIIFKDGKIKSFDNHIIHSLNKNEISIPNNFSHKLSERNTVILIGDQTTDINMAQKSNDKDVISIGFYIDEKTTSLSTLNSIFDIVAHPNESYNDLINLLFYK